MNAAPMRRPPISPYVAEFLGVAILLAVGLSAVSIDFGAGSPVARAIPEPVLRRLLTGSIFAGTGTLVVYSILGRISGGHLNPAMTLAFVGLGKVEWRTATGYVFAQVAGALVGAAAVGLLWGSLATSVRDGATTPGPDGPAVALAAGILVATLVTIEAPISGTSLNPARTLGPAIVAGVYTDLWVYFAAPFAGALAAVAAFAALTDGVIPCAKLFHTNEFACHFRACAYQRRDATVPLGSEERAEPQPKEATT